MTVRTGWRGGEESSALHFIGRGGGCSRVCAANCGTVLAGDEAGQLPGVVVQRGVAEMTAKLTMRMARRCDASGWRRLSQAVLCRGRRCCARAAWHGRACSGKAAAGWGLGGGRHGMVPAAARGGPACRACVVSASEAAGGPGLASCSGHAQQLLLRRGRVSRVACACVVCLADELARMHAWVASLCLCSLPC